VLVKLHLYDLVEAAIGVGKVFVHLFAKIGEIVLGGHLAFDMGDVVGDCREAELDGREDGIERCLAFWLASLRPYPGTITRRSTRACLLPEMQVPAAVRSMGLFLTRSDPFPMNE
jgi:hypothetical protein